MNTMSQRYEASPREVERMNTQELRDDFLITDLLVGGEINFVYSHYDRIVVGGAVPTKAAVELAAYETLKSKFFLERRELGIINVGGGQVRSRPMGQPIS